MVKRSTTKEKELMDTLAPVIGQISVSVRDHSEITSRLIIKIKDYLTEIWEEKVKNLVKHPDQVEWELKFDKPLSSGIRLKLLVEGNKFTNLPEETFDDLHLVVSTIMHTGPALLVDLGGGFLPTILDRNTPIELVGVISDTVKLRLEHAGVVWPYRKVTKYGVQFGEVLLTDSLRLSAALNLALKE